MDFLDVWLFFLLASLFIFAAASFLFIFFSFPAFSPLFLLLILIQPSSNAFSREPFKIVSS